MSIFNCFAIQTLKKSVFMTIQQEVASKEITNKANANLKEAVI